MTNKYQPINIFCNRNIVPLTNYVPPAFWYNILEGNWLFVWLKFKQARCIHDQHDLFVSTLLASRVTLNLELWYDLNLFKVMWMTTLCNVGACGLAYTKYQVQWTSICYFIKYKSRYTSQAECNWLNIKIRWVLISRDDHQD